MPTNDKVNRSSVFTRTYALGLILLFIGIAYGEDLDFGSFSTQPNDVVEGSTATAVSLKSVPAETDLSPKKEGENRRHAVAKDKPAERSAPNPPSRAKPIRLNSASPTSPSSKASNPKQRPIIPRQLSFERQVEITKKFKEIVGRTKSSNTASANQSSKRQKPIFNKIPQNRKTYNRRLLMARYSPSAIFADGQPTPANPLGPEVSDVAQTLNVNRVSKALELYSKLLYGGVRLTQLDGTRFEADGEVFRGKGLPQGCFLLFRWFINCCSADAQPFGIVVHSNELNNAQSSFWVHVAGTMKFQMAGGKKIAYIKAETVQTIPTPPPAKRYITY
jgi:hypothetical protein